MAVFYVENMIFGVMAVADGIFAKHKSEVTSDFILQSLVTSLLCF